MDIRDKCQDGNKISTIMTLPEETMCEIFNYLSFETLYFSLRNVCKNLQIYVDHYLKLRGSSFLVGGQEGLETEVIEIIKQPGNGLIILRTPLSSNSFITSKLQHNASLDKHPARLIDKVLYAAMRESGVCYIYKNKDLIYRYDLESDKWEKIFEDSTALRCLYHIELSHECIATVVLEDFPYYFENDSYGYYNYPAVQVQEKDKPLSVCKIVSCKRLRL